MRAIAVMAMVYLPGAFVAVSKLECNDLIAVGRKLTRCRLGPIRDDHYGLLG